jgi:hypothetical protein
LPKCIDYTGVKGSHSANKKTKFWIQQRSKVRTEGPLVWEHRTVSGAPEDSSSNSPPSGISRGTRAIIHRTVRCTKEDQPQELASFGKLQRLVRYNSPDCPVCTGLSGATAISAPTATCDALNARAARAEIRRAHTGTPDSKQYLSGVHRTPRRAHKSEAPTVRIQRQ